MYLGLYIKYPLFVSYFNETRIFLDRILKNTQSIEINPYPANVENMVSS